MTDTQTAVYIEDVEGTELYQHYPQQCQAQPCYIELECETGRLRADYNGEIGNAVPVSVWHGHDQRWTIPALTADSANKLMAEIKPLAQRVVDGYESECDGSNHVARFDDDAKSAIEEIERKIESWDGEMVKMWAVADWYESATHWNDEKTACEIGDWTITAETTGTEIGKIAHEMNIDLVGEDEIDGFDDDPRDFLTKIREECRDNEEEDA